MSTHKFLYFGHVDGNQPNSRYDAYISVDGNPVSLDLHFDQRTIPAGLDSTTNQFLEKITSLDQHHKNSLHNDYDADGETLDYIRFFLDELGPRDLRRLLGDQFDNLSAPKQLLDKLQLVRVGVYPDAEDGFLAICDYSLAIDGQPSEQVIAISTDENGDVLDIAWES